MTPGTLRDHVRLMATWLPPELAHARYQEILGASFAAGRIPDEQLVAHAVRLGRWRGRPSTTCRTTLAAKLPRPSTWS
ncbi:hypothetical protein ACQP1W_06285 [Spirillospora sp. CA-255316]